MTAIEHEYDEGKQIDLHALIKTMRQERDAAMYQNPPNPIERYAHVVNSAVAGLAREMAQLPDMLDSAVAALGKELAKYSGVLNSAVVKLAQQELIRLRLETEAIPWGGKPKPSAASKPKVQPKPIKPHARSKRPSRRR